MCAYRVLLESEYEAPRSKLQGIQAKANKKGQHKNSVALETDPVIYLAASTC
jgi:hypothetical protein